MFTSGLVSISFRNLSPSALLEHCKTNALSTIEWGSDIHAPNCELSKVQEIKELSDKYHVLTTTYGSYYKLGQTPQSEILSTLNAAQILKADTVRIWGGVKGSEQIDSKELNDLVIHAKNICAEAKTYNIDICLECHPNTITDSWEKSLDFLEAVNCENLKMYWQPNQHKSYEYNIESIKRLRDNVKALHVFHWIKDIKYPLQEGYNIWCNYLSLFRETGKNYLALLEFMHDDRIESLPQTAKTLIRLISLFND